MTDRHPQLNAEVAPEELRRIKRDVVEVGTSLKDYVQAALVHFRQTLSIEQRRRRFEKSRKLTGRKIKT
jgi:hypothetical protein